MDEKAISTSGPNEESGATYDSQGEPRGWDPMSTLLVFSILQILIIVIEWWVAGSYFLAYSSTR